MPETITDRKCCHTCGKASDKKLSKCGRCHAITYCGPQCQREDWARHSYHCVPVMISEIPGKGRGLVASKDLKSGDLLFVDTAVIILDSPEGMLTPSVAKSLKDQIGKMSKEEKTLFYNLKSGQTDDPGNSHHAMINHIGARENCREEAKIFFNNCLKIGSGPYSDTKKSCFLVHPILNHSCAPNAFPGRMTKLSRKYKEPKLRMEVRAIKDISKGEEVTICYLHALPSMQYQSVMRKNLLESYNFECKCDVCIGIVPDQDIIKRRLWAVNMEYFNTAPTQGAHEKSRSGWRREALLLEKILDLTIQLYVGPMRTSSACDALAISAQLARDSTLLSKAMNTMKELAEKTKSEEHKIDYEELQKKFSKFAQDFSSKKPPSKEEIDFITTITA